MLLDFNEGRVYIENNNKKLIYTITTQLNQLGIEIIPVAWTYSLPNWTAEVLGIALRHSVPGRLPETRQ